MTIDEYLERSGDSRRVEENDHSKLVDQMMRSPSLIGIHVPTVRIFKNIRLFGRGRTYGQIDLVIKTELGEYHAVAVKQIQSRNADIADRKRLMKRELQTAYDFFRDEHRVLVYRIAAHCCAGSSKVEYLEIPRDVSDVLDFIKKGITT